MAHWANVDSDNRVTSVLVMDDNHFTDTQSHTWLVDTFGGKWIKTSYNTKGKKHLLGGTPLRGNFAEPTMLYDETKDVFYHTSPPDMFPSWVFNETNLLWEPRVEKPHDGKNYIWREQNVDWEQVG